MSKLEVHLIRISATQNSFLFVDATQNDVDIILKQFSYSNVNQFVMDWTTGRKGVLADGLVFVKKPIQSNLDFEWEFYNNDGSSAEMCGNASRAMWIFCKQYLNHINSNLIFLTRAGPIKLSQNISSQIIVHMPIWKVNEVGFEIVYNNKKYYIDSINTGVPHLVVEIFENELNPERLLTVAKELRQLQNWDKDGSNVTFFKKNKTTSFVSALTYERGIEDFTLSCGTGAVAAALSYLLKESTNESSSESPINSENKIMGKKIRNESFKEDTNFISLKHMTKSVDVFVPGGKLIVEVDFNTNEANLIGDACVDFEITINQKL